MYGLGAKLLSSLEESRLPRDDENVKGIGWFLVCVGESHERGSLLRARQIRSQGDLSKGEVPKVTSLAVAFCLAGDDMMNWGAALFNRRRNEDQGKNQAR